MDSAGESNNSQNRQQSTADDQPELAESVWSVRLNNAEVSRVGSFRQRRLEIGCSLEAGGGRFGEALEDNGIQRRRCTQRLRGLVQNRAQSRSDRRRRKGTPSGKNFVEHRAKRNVNFDNAPEIASGSRDREMVAIDDALNELAQIDQRKAKVIELRFFDGLSVEETAEVLKISPQSVMRDWKMAMAWLLAELAH